MENIFGLTTCVAIVVIAYLVGIVVKNTDAIDDKWIPAICGIVGAPLGVLALHIVPDFPATDYLTAVAVGIVSGLESGIQTAPRQLKTACPNWTRQAKETPRKPGRLRSSQPSDVGLARRFSIELRALGVFWGCLAC